MAAVDFSATSARALKRAAHLASVDKCELHVLHVSDPPWDRLYHGGGPIQDLPRLINQYRVRLQARLEEFMDAQLVCLGTRGPSNVRDVLLGSKAEKALANSKCSVLAVRPDLITDY